MAQLRDGHYRLLFAGEQTTDNFLLGVQGRVLTYTEDGKQKSGSIEYGQFGNADSLVSKKTLEENYNVKFSYEDLENEEEKVYEEFGVTKDDCLGAFFFNKMEGLMFEYEWVNEEVAADIAKMPELTEPVGCPTCPYKLQPEYQGRLLWITGAPGVGKSTSAQLVARLRGCVYYEGDCFAFARNPYISVDGSNPTGNHSVQRRLVGEGLEERKQALEEMWEEGVLKQVPEAREKHYKLLCKDILQERSRIGGDWVVAEDGLINKYNRNLVRSILGPELVVVVLTMSQELVRQRLTQRHAGYQPEVNELLGIGPKLYSPVEEEEARVAGVEVTESMSRQEVCTRILDTWDAFHTQQSNI